MTALAVVALHVSSLWSEYLILWLYHHNIKWLCPTLQTMSGNATQSQEPNRFAHTHATLGNKIPESTLTIWNDQIGLGPEARFVHNTSQWSSSSCNLWQISQIFDWKSKIIWSLIPDGLRVTLPDWSFWYHRFLKFMSSVWGQSQVASCGSLKSSNLLFSKKVQYIPSWLLKFQLYCILPPVG